MLYPDASGLGNNFFTRRLARIVVSRWFKLRVSHLQENPFTFLNRSVLLLHERFVAFLAR